MAVQDSLIEYQQEDDVGIGDIVARLIHNFNFSDFVILTVLEILIEEFGFYSTVYSGLFYLLGKDCKCPNKQDELDRRYPL